MSFLRLHNISRLGYLLVCALVLPLVACSGGDGGAAGGTADGTAVLSWVAPSEREDSTALSPSEIVGYRIYYGVESGIYQDPIVINDHTATQAQFSGIPSGAYFVVMTTVDTDGRESAWSAPEVEVSF